MSSLAEVFNFLFALVFVFIRFITGGLYFNSDGVLISGVSNLPEDIQIYARQFFENLGYYFPEFIDKIQNGEPLVDPIIFLALGIFVVGAVIGLVRRLIRG